MGLLDLLGLFADFQTPAQKKEQERKDTLKRVGVGVGVVTAATLAAISTGASVTSAQASNEVNKFGNDMRNVGNEQKN